MAYYYNYYISKEHSEALRKNRSLIKSLHDSRDNFCVIGTRLVKLLLNKHTDEISKIYRLALEIEDINIQAKEARWKYRDKKYDQKETHLKELYDLCKNNNILSGIHNESTYTTDKIIFFDLPDTEQISWHTNAIFTDDTSHYPFQWDGKVNSTLTKLEGVISYRYKDDILKSAQRNKKGDISQQLDAIIERYKLSYDQYLQKRKESETRIQENRKTANETIQTFENTTTFSFLQKNLNEPISIMADINEDKVTYSIVSNNTTIVSGLTNRNTSSNQIVFNNEDRHKIIKNIVEKNMTFPKTTTIDDIISFVLDSNDTGFSYTVNDDTITVTRNDGKSIKAFYKENISKYNTLAVASFLINQIRHFNKKLNKQEKKNKIKELKKKEQ